MSCSPSAVCFTGHRHIPEAHYEKLSDLLDKLVLGLASIGITYFLCGGALGFDTMAAKAVLRLRNAGKRIRLVLILPCRNQTRGWSEKDVEIYEHIRESADEVIYTSDQYFNGCMQKRNRRLVDESDACVAYLTSPKGGTAYTVNYAKALGREVYNLADDLK